ncbi:CaiB/BaiF CoA-transferase family protein [uncultured Megasphaera sp.]|uniref:CaiB/BaiF CoA transferase family protein n=1 Tax=uncultured Megasphaera sp. TaxID=165188 RepID=UPI00265A66A7|nr:CoA transferase [uncultured Megasphaera sp.]
MTKPLQGIRVLDLTRVLSGPYCTMLLADMGAEVIKIETPVHGDDSRAYPPFDNGISAYYANLNRNKKSMVLNLRDEKGKEVLRQLIKISDVFVENFKPGTIAKMGFSYEEVKKLNPQIIFASISGFGQTGPYRLLPGYDVIAQAMSGMMSVTGWPDSPPTRTGTAIGDVLGGLNCCIGILAALQGRHSQHHGEYVDVGLVDCSVSAMETITEIYLVEHRIPKRAGNRYEFIYPYDSFETMDKWVVIGVGNDAIWERFCKATGHLDWLENARFALNKDRASHKDELHEMVTSWTKQHTAKDVIELLRAASVPCAPIHDVADVVTDEHIAKAREMICEIDHPVEGKMHITGNPIKMTEAGRYTYAKAPTLGKDTESILTELLGMSAEEATHMV